MGTSSISVLSVILLVSVFWKPAFGNDKCSIACTGSPTTQAFLNGHKYNYGVEGTVTIYVTGASNQETSVKLLGQVSVAAVGNCVHELAVQNLVISGPDGKKHQSPPGIEKPVRFTLQDGRIGAEICSEADDTRRSLNIKRAIISLLQTEQKSSTQVDIFGTCPTDVSSSQEGGAVLVHRSRDLSRCGHREQGKHELISGIFNPNAEIKDTQVLRSSMNVETKVNNGVPEKVAATEEYLYRPFSVGENGARAKVHTKLTLTGKARAANAPSHCTESRTIIFENPHGVAMNQNNMHSALNAVKETAKTLANEAGSKSAGNFAQLVRILRTCNKADLMNVYSHVKGNNVEKRVFLDGLIRAGTGYSIEASIQLLKSKELGPLEQKLVFLSLGNARHVNNEAVKAAASILDTANLPKEVYLGVGALAGIFCREHQCHKVRNDGIAALSQKFAGKLQNCRPKTKLDEDNVVAVLKGIRNMHHLEDNLVDKLSHCAQDNNVKARVKAAALEAFQADPCASKLKKTAIDLMKNRQLDSEIRIKAYLAVIACPCSHSASEIKNLLDNEPVHQVGNFISTSLRNIRSSSNPDKQLARQHYGLIRTPNKFNNDVRKYSFSVEESFNIDALGLGGNVEKNVIYSQDSFLPRSVSLNLTTEIFGHSLNVLEVGGRQGNLDRVAEHLLGPKGFFRTEDLQNIYKNFIVKPLDEYKQKAESAVSRGRRSVKTDVDSFDKNLKAEATPYNSELDLDLYIKLFGTDAVFLSLGDGKGFDLDKVVDQFMQYVNKGINEVKHFQQEVRAHLLFLDAELAYPTSTGLPLKLDLIGSATGRFEAATNIDIRQCLKSPQDAKVDIKLVPSTDIEITGALLVDADAISAGLKVIVNLHSSTGGHVIAKVLENGRGFDLQVGLPIDKQEIITASNDLVYFYAVKGQPEKHTPVKTDLTMKETSGCFDQAADFLGLTVCGEMNVPFTFSGPEAQASISKFIASYPLSGSAKVRVLVEKQNLRGYHIKGVMRADEAGRRGFEILFDAEGAKHGRAQLSGEYVYSQREIGAKLALDSALKVINGQVAMTRSPSELTLLVKGQYDANEVYGKVGFNVQGGGGRTVYKPIAEYKMPGEKEKHNIPISGQVIEEVHDSTRKYTIEGVKLNLPSMKEPICIDGHAGISGAKDFDFDVVVKDLANFKGSLKNNDVTAEFMNKLNPYINFRLKGHFEHDQVTRNEIDLVYGGDLRNQQNRVCFGQMYKYHKNSEEDFNLITKNKFEIYAIPLIARFDADIDPKKLDIEASGQYMDKKAEFDLDARTHIKKQGDYSLKIKTLYDKNGVEVFSKRDIVSADKSNLENYIEFKNIGKYELSGVVLHKTKPNDMNVGAIGHLKVTMGSKAQDIKFDVGVIETPSLYSSHAKVTESQGEVLDYLLKFNRGPNANGQLKLVIKNTISANGQFKVADDKGNGMIIVDFVKAQRKIKGDFKFQAKAPNYGADVDIFLNYEKDNHDKIHYSATAKKTEKLLDTKNKFEYNGKKFELNVRQDGVYSTVGKTHALFELVLPTDRCLTLKVDRDVSQNKDTYNGHAEVLLSDATKRGGAASTISYKGKLSNTNFDKEIINYEGQVELKLKGGKKLLNTFFLKNNPDGDKFKFDFKTELTGNLAPKPASISGHYIYLDSTTNRDDKYRLKANYGDDTNLEVTGVLEVKALDKGDKKYLDDYTVTISLPFEKAHDIKYVSTVLYLQPENKDQLEYTIVESVQVNADVYKIDANGKVGEKSGFSTVKLLVPHVDPVTLEVNYKNDKTDDKIDSHAEVKAKYGKGKSASVAMDASVAPRDNSLSIKASTPHIESLKRLEFTVHSKNPAPDTYVSNVLIDADGRVYKSDSSFVFSKAHPLIDVKYTSPSSPKTSRLYIKGSSLSSTQGKVEMKVENIRDISADLTSEASIQKDNVAFKMVANSEQLGYKNYQVEIASKDTSNGKRLEFKAVNDNKNVLSGSTSFISKQEKDKMIIEGSGAVKVKDEQKSANFKYIRTILGEGNEKGVETFFNIAIGERSYVAESRVTNLEYKNSYVYCEEKKQCAHAEINSKIDISKPGVIQNVVTAGFDLRKLGIAPEFGLNIKDEVSDKKMPQYTMDVHINKEDKKYHLHVYNTPEHGNAKSGITVNLPTRVLALESVVTYPTNKGLPFPIRGEVCLDMDKNKQGHKTSARFLVDLDVSNENQQSAVAEFGFNHPKMNKEAVVKIGGVVQRPAQNSVKIETSASVSHPALGATRESKILFEGSPTHVKVLVNTPLVKVIDVEGTATVNDNLQKAEVKFCLLEGKPVAVTAIAKDYQYFEFTTDESDRKLSIVGHIQPEKRVDVSADIVLGGQKKNIVHGALFLDDNLIKSDYGASKENFNYFFAALKKDLDNLAARIKQLGDKANNDFKATLKRVEPTLQNVQKAYAEDIKKFYQEIADDKALKEISHAFNEIVHYLAKIIDDVIQGTKPIVDKMTQVYIDTAKKIQDMYEKKIEPQIKQIYDTIAHAVKEYLDSIIDVVAHIGAMVQDFYQKHKPELEELTNALTSIFKDLTRLLVAQLKEFRARVTQLTAELSQQVKELPIVALLKEKFQELAVPEQGLALLQDVYNTIRAFMPTPETRDFSDALHAYVMKKLKQEKCDDQKELRVVYQKLSTAITSLIQFIRTQLGQFGVTGPVGSFNPMSFTPGELQSAPSFGGSASASPLSSLLQGDVPDVIAMIKAYRPKNLNPFDEVPAKLRAVVINGQHIFTFDGRHLTFPGNCRYVLAHDHVDRNFTLMMQLVNGAPKSLILEDKHGAIIELKDNGQATLNGANHGYPVIEKDSFAFRQANGRIGVGSLYGIMAFCSPKLEVCYFEVNGYYLGKLRGLLGDGNNEPFDDFRLPNGKVCESESEFGNAYRLSRSCPQVQAPEHNHHQLHHMALPPACEKVFGGSSPLRPIGLFMDIAPFRQACIHACSGDSAEALQQACDLARGYTALAVNSLLPAVLPDVCVQCRDADKPRNVGDSYELKVPNKQADIVVTFETTIDNEKNYKDIVVPLVSQVIDSLKSKRVNDVKVYLVGITSKYPYPIVYDTDPKLKNAKVQFTDKSRYQTHNIEHGQDPVLRAASVVANIYDALTIQLGLTNVVASYSSIFDLPLRAGAIKHTINVVGEECVSQFFLVEAARSVAFGAMFENMAYSHSLVTVTPSLKIGNGKQYSQIVGYTERAVIMLGDKKVGKEAENLRSTLEKTDDACRDFVESTDGIVFSATNFHKMNAGQQKQYIQTAAAAINQRMLHETLVQDCTCTYVDPLRVRSICVNKDRKEVARRRK
ncbi:retinoid- and fatty-acid binding glycoprotein apolipophorin isoform X2 [Anticarsia gemmatalis]|uniref:retinoid- and fatty-acid binding glycoprotein apolipophorin isoform X2 n=1 Tax=Anticarsia gemmatalis TaxID=129554 RepID=UPI003F7739A4